jgi:MFS family permease
VWVTVAAFMVAVLCVFAQWYALAPSIARNFYGHVWVFGVLESMAGVGAVCGAFVGMKWRPARPLRAGLLMVLAWPLMAAVFALGAPLALTFACAFATGVGFSLFMIWWETALAQHIPPHALSRVSSYDWMGSLALLPLGYLLAGPLASAFGARTVLLAGSVIGAAMLLLALVPRATRELGAPAGEQRVREKAATGSRAFSA